MAEYSKPAETDTVQCEQCLKEVPKSEEKVAEASDYVMYLCGLDCYEKWQKESKSKE